LADEEKNPMATTEWRAIWLGVCIAIVIAAVLWLADVTPPLGASMIGMIVGIAVAVIYGRILARMGEP
jgi:hypothetical protein